MKTKLKLKYKIPLYLIIYNLKILLFELNFEYSNKFLKILTVIQETNTVNKYIKIKNNIRKINQFERMFGITATKHVIYNIILILSMILTFSRIV